MWLVKVLRLIFVTLDGAIYQLVNWLYQLFMLLAETGVFRDEVMHEFSERIYFFLGLIMVFKVSISLLQYILNPDAVNDGKIGAGKLLKNLVFVFVVIIFVPYVFEAAFSLQRIILKDNIIGNLILGTNLSGSSTNAESVVKDTGKIMAFSTFTAFFNFDRTYIDDKCSSQPFEIVRGSNPRISSSDLCVGSTTENDEFFIGILNEFYDSDAGELYKAAYKNNDVFKITNHMKVFNYTFEDDDGEEQFLFDYTILVTSAAGVFLSYILLVFCFDVAVRAVKLGFLQLIAPVPLMAKLDPKKGDEVFSKWVKECTSTYVNLFVRLVAIYFALFIITIIFNSDGLFNVVTKDDITNPLVYVFIIFGVLLFVKDLPKLIETLTGMKISGGLSLSKKMRSVPLVGGALDQGAKFAGRTLGRGVGALAGTVGGLANRGRRALSSGLGKAWKDSSIGQWHQQRVLDGIDLGSRARRLGAKIGNAAHFVGGELKKADDFTGGHFQSNFKRLGEDAKTTGVGMLGALEASSGALERRERALAAEEGAILRQQAERKSIIERNKTMAAADDAVRARAAKKVKESAVYAQKELKIESMKEDLKLKIAAGITDADRENLEASIAKEVADFGKWSNKTAVLEYIDGTGDFAGRDDSQLTDLVAKRDQTARDLGYASSYVGRTAKEADDATSALNSINTQYEGSLAGENQQLSQIKEERRQIAETRRASKEFMGPGFGPGGPRDK